MRSNVSFGFAREPGGRIGSRGAVVDVVGPGVGSFERDVVSVFVFVVVVVVVVVGGAGAVFANAGAVAWAASAFPDDVVVCVVVDGDVVVHGVAVGIEVAGEDAGVEDAEEGFGGGGRTDGAFE